MHYLPNELLKSGMMQTDLLGAAQIRRSIAFNADNAWLAEVGGFIMAAVVLMPITDTPADSTHGLLPVQDLYLLNVI